MAPASWACLVQRLPGCDLDRLGDYQVFTRAFDREVGGDALVAPNRLPGLRAELDRHRKAQAVSAARVAQRLIRALARPAEDGWTLPRTTVNWIRPAWP